MKSLSATSIALGVVLLLASAFWGQLFPATNSWTDQKSQRLAELGAETNRLKFALVEAQHSRSMHAGQSLAEAKEAYDQARQEYDVLHQQFESARDRPQTVAAAVRWTGIVLAAAGAMLLYVKQNSA